MMETEEEWVPVYRYPHYEVSNFGQVRNHATGNILRGTRRGYRQKKDAYRQYSFSTAYGTVTEYAARVVWTSFNGPVPDGMTLWHKDHDRLNDSLENLECVTREELGYLIALERREAWFADE